MVYIKGLLIVVCISTTCISIRCGPVSLRLQHVVLTVTDVRGVNLKSGYMLSDLNIDQSRTSEITPRCKIFF